MNKVKVFKYIASVPERAIKSIILIASGLVEILIEILFPTWFRKSASYKVTIGLTQEFIKTKIGHMKSEDVSSKVDDHYIARKTAGTLIEAAGLFTIRFSPLWFFAIVSDLSGGSKEYFLQLNQELIRTGVISNDSNFNDTYELLAALEQSSKATATVMDMPPLSKEDIDRSKDDILKAYGLTVESAKKLAPDIDDLWKSMNGFIKNGVDLTTIAGIMTSDALKTVTKDYTNEKIVQEYKRTIQKMNEEGVHKYTFRKMKPFIMASFQTFNVKQESLTEKSINSISHFIEKSKKRI